MKRILILFLLALAACTRPSNPVDALLERIDPGASRRIETEIRPAAEAYFEIDGRGGKPVIRGDSPVHVAVGLNWYLKYHCGIQVSRECPTVELPAVLPVPSAPGRTTEISIGPIFSSLQHRSS